MSDGKCQQIRGARGFRRARRSRRSRPAGESTNQTPSSSRSLSTNSLVTTAPPAGIGLTRRTPDSAQCSVKPKSTGICGTTMEQTCPGSASDRGRLLHGRRAGPGHGRSRRRRPWGTFWPLIVFLRGVSPRAPRLKAVFLRGVPPRAPRLKAPLLLLVCGLPHGVVAPRQEPKIPRSYTRIFRLDGALAAIIPVARFLNASRISSDMNFPAVLRSRLASSFAAESTSSSISRVVRINRSRPTRGGDHIPLVKRALIPIRNAVLHLASSGHGTVAGARRGASGFRRDKRL